MIQYEIILETIYNDGMFYHSGIYDIWKYDCKCFFSVYLRQGNKRSIEEMKIFRYALMASLEGLPTEYRASDMAIVEITKSIKKVWKIITALLFIIVKKK